MISESGCIGSPNMPPPIELLGRDALVRQVIESLAAGHSVLLFGPEGIGKSAVVAAVPGDHVIVDPFEHVSRQAASRMRRALDRGTIYLGATRATNRKALGAVGRILWRFSMIRVRELPDSILGRIVTIEVRRSIPDFERAWVRDLVALAKGRPGFAVTMARFAIQWHRRHGYLPMASLVFAATREDAAIRSLHSASLPSRARARARS